MGDQAEFLRSQDQKNREERNLALVGGVQCDLQR